VGPHPNSCSLPSSDVHTSSSNVLVGIHIQTGSVLHPNRARSTCAVGQISGSVRHGRVRSFGQTCKYVLESALWLGLEGVVGVRYG
jgi:hypothetical protein